MTANPPVYEDWSGDTLAIFVQDDSICVTVKPVYDDGSCIDITFDSVRKVTAAMHEKAGLPDRWAALKAWVGAGHEPWCADVLEKITELEAGQ